MPIWNMRDGQDFDHSKAEKFMGMPATQPRARGGSASAPVRKAASQAAVGRANMNRAGMPGLATVARRVAPVAADTPGAAMSVAARPRPMIRGGVPASNMQMPGPAPTTMKDGGALSYKERQSLPKSDFALPGKGSGKSGKGPGSYPIPDAAHARNALARVSQHGTPAEKSKVRAKVHSAFPSIKMAMKAEGGAVDMAQDKRMIASAMRKDESEDKRMIKSAMRQHETQEHGGKHSSIKLAHGGRMGKKGVPAFARGGLVGNSLPSNQRPPKNPTLTRTPPDMPLAGGVLPYGVQPSTEKTPGDSQMYGNAMKRRGR